MAFGNVRLQCMILIVCDQSASNPGSPLRSCALWPRTSPACLYFKGADPDLEGSPKWGTVEVCPHTLCVYRGNYLMGP